MSVLVKSAPVRVTYRGKCMLQVTSWLALVWLAAGWVLILLVAWRILI